MHQLTDGGLRLDFHNFRLLQKVMCKLLYFLWQCCGEHADRRVFWKTKEYLLDSFNKPHIQHFIRFIDNDIADFICSKGSLLQMVKHSSRCSCDNMGPLLYILCLKTEGLLPEYGSRLNALIGTDVIKFSLDLQGKLSGRTQYQSLR